MNSPALDLELTRLALIALLFLMASILLFRYIPTPCSPFSISIATTYPFTHIHDFPSHLLYTLHILLPFLSFSWSALRYTWRWAFDDPFPLLWHKTHTSLFSSRLKNATGCRYGAPAQCYDWTTDEFAFWSALEWTG